MGCEVKTDKEVKLNMGLWGSNVKAGNTHLGAARANSLHFLGSMLCGVNWLEFVKNGN